MGSEEARLARMLLIDIGRYRLALIDLDALLLDLQFYEISCQFPEEWLADFSAVCAELAKMHDRPADDPEIEESLKAVEALLRQMSQ